MDRNAKLHPRVVLPFNLASFDGSTAQGMETQCASALVGDGARLPRSHALCGRYRASKRGGDAPGRAAAHALPTLRNASPEKADHSTKDLARRLSVIRDILHTLTARRFGKRGVSSKPLTPEERYRPDAPDCRSAVACPRRRSTRPTSASPSQQKQWMQVKSCKPKRASSRPMLPASIPRCCS
jgi:hypothetical protein